MPAHPLILAGALAAVLAAQAPLAAPLPCAKADRDCAVKAGKAHAARTAAFWKSAFARPLAERVGPAPPGLVEYLNLDNIANGFPETPRASALTADFLADLRGALDDLPPAVRRLIDESFAGVWLVDDLGGTGYTDMIMAPGERPIGAYIVLDAKVLGKFTANEWATWKENTPFRPAPGWTLEARIEEGAANDRRGAIRYILLHELGHVVSVNRDVHPRWDRAPKDVPAGERYPFFELSWRIDRKAGKYVSAFDEAFALRRSVVYYVGAKLEAAQMPAAYASLERTNLPTLYAATIPGDDFAESFASYVHTVLLKRPWEITIRKDGKVEKTYGSCWNEARCAGKRRILEALLR